jgi:hypothetical protein
MLIYAQLIQGITLIVLTLWLGWLSGVVLRLSKQLLKLIALINKDLE